ncbi:DNA-binding transcriptional LysR family regulator [Psychromicrobium silvestre]|uniref:DNA-binding transcriptional LysR family regulator n=1 Tax=Psychromicrobium silvestre TaxID=1645614 RepID=A0A7Y9S714_9MICC|nr:LysR substrate-binding domain-containing protein [Psychromicrobium silvestre]NYE95794.1 DNA-binding transcriptional LysR family regulator [Psychromicrobium silvestre]
MELSQLRYFAEIARTENMSQAARNLYVSQPGLSRSLAALEEELGVELFLRRGRGLQLSAAGRTFLQSVQAVEALLVQAKESLAEDAAPGTGLIRLGYLGSLGWDLLPQLVHSYRQRHPQIRFQLLEGAAGELRDRLESGELDLLLSMPPLVDHAVQYTKILEQTLVALLPTGHRLARRKRLSLEELLGEEFLALRQGNTLREVFDGACRSSGLSPRIGFESDSVATVRGLVAAGEGVALLPAVEGGLQGVVEVAVTPAVTRTIAIGYLAERRLSQAAQDFLDWAPSAVPA